MSIFLKKWGSLVVLSLALAIVIIDTTLLNVSLRAIIGDLHTDIQSIQWVITAYALMLAAFTITGGRLGDLFGRKKMFMLGAILFGVGSFIASISHSIGPLIWGEAIIEGIGAALMMPATSSLLVASFKGRERAIAFGVWGGIAAASSAIGPVLGGWLTSHYSWRWGFRINIVVVAILLIGSLLVKESRDERETPKLDFVGVILSALGLLSMVFGFIKASDYGWIKAKAPFVAFGHTFGLGGASAVPIFIALGIIILELFALWELRRERRGETPLVSLHIFQNRQFTAGVVTIGIFSLGLSGLIFSIPVFLQAVRGLDAFHTGLAMLPMSIALLVFAPFSAFLVKHFTPTRIIQTGLAIVVAGFLVLRASLSVTATASDLIFGFLVFGGGMGLIMAQLNNVILSALPLEFAGEASGVTNTFRQVGTSLGSAILGAILLSSLSSNIASGITRSNRIPEAAKPVIAESYAKNSSEVEFGGGSGSQLETGTGAGGSPEIAEELSRISKKAATNANRLTLLYGAIFSLLGFFMSLGLPNTMDIDKHHNDDGSKVIAAH